jgi:hypothetical protein
MFFSLSGRRVESSHPTLERRIGEKGAETSAARQRYGPRSLPLFHTALQKPPERLVVRDLPFAPPYRVTLGITDSTGSIAPPETVLVSGPEIAWPLEGLSFRLGETYAWRVEPGASLPSEAAEYPLLPVQAGRFWLLEPERLAHLEQGREALNSVADPDFAAIAMALLMTEMGLFQDALQLVRNGPARSARVPRVLLAHIVQALIYRQMGKHLAVDRASETLPACFRLWAENREQYHRSLGEAQMGGEPRPRVIAPTLASPPGRLCRKQVTSAPTRQAA